MVADIVQNLDRLFRQVGDCPPLALDFISQSALLLLQGAQEECQPRLPVRSLAADGALGLAQGQIIAFLAVLNHTLKGRIRHIGITGLQQQERGQDTAQAAIAVLKRVDLQEDDGENGDDQQGMNPAKLAGLAQPSYKLLYPTMRIKRRGGLEDDTDHFTVGVVYPVRPS